MIIQLNEIENFYKLEESLMKYTSSLISKISLKEIESEVICFLQESIKLKNIETFHDLKISYNHNNSIIINGYAISNKHKYSKAVRQIKQYDRIFCIKYFPPYAKVGQILFISSVLIDAIVINNTDGLKYSFILLKSKFSEYFVTVSQHREILLNDILNDEIR